MKQLDNPVPEEVAKFEQFADTTLWGQIQTPDGADKYGVRKSVMFYDPKTMPEGTYDPKLKWDVWSAWDREGAADLGRSYNYPHAAAAFWRRMRKARGLLWVNGASHLGDSERIAFLERVAAEIDARRAEGEPLTPDYARFSASGA